MTNINPYDVNAYNDALTLTNYNYGVPMDSYTFNDCLYGAGTFAGLSTVWKSGNWLLKNRHDYRTGWQNVKNQYASASSLMTKNPLKNAWNYNKANTLLNLERSCYPEISANTQGLNLTAKQRLRHMKQSRISRQYNDARALINDTKEEFRQGKLKGKRFKVRQRQINQALQEAESKVSEIKSVKGRGKTATNSATNAATNSAKTAAAKGGTIGAGTVKTAAKGSNGKLLKIAGKAGKCVKGNLFAAAIGLVLEAPTIINAYNVASKDKKCKSLGHKQLAHSVGKVAVGLLGYAAGSAALGAAVGSVVPVAGTAVGAVVGLVGGCIGYFLADKAYNKLVPSPLEQYSKKQAKEALKNPEKMKEVLQNTEQKAENETDETVLAELQQSYDNLAEQTQDDTIENEEVQSVKKTDKQYPQQQLRQTSLPSTSSDFVDETEIRNKSKLQEIINWYINKFEMLYEQYNNSNQLFNSCNSYYPTMTNYPQINNQYHGYSSYNSFAPYETTFLQRNLPYGYIG